MSNPAYLWLTDENGSPMSGSSLVVGRVGAIEIKSLTHNINIPVDSNTGRLTGTRIHAPIMFQKRIRPGYTFFVQSIKYRSYAQISDDQNVLN